LTGTTCLTRPPLLNVTLTVTFAALTHDSRLKGLETTSHPDPARTSSFRSWIVRNVPPSSLFRFVPQGNLPRTRHGFLLSLVTSLDGVRDGPPAFWLPGVHVERFRGLRQPCPSAANIVPLNKPLDMKDKREAYDDLSSPSQSVDPARQLPSSRVHCQAETTNVTFSRRCMALFPPTWCLLHNVNNYSKYFPTIKQLIASQVSLVYC
jgi:hypothetical protein